MPERFMCSSHTLSGVMPGGPLPARHGFEARVAAAAAAGYHGFWLHWREHAALRDAGRRDADLRQALDDAGLRLRGVEFLTDWFLDTGPARQDVAAALAAAAAIGATTLNIGGDFHGRGLGLAERRERLAALCERAAAEGVAIAVEFVPWSDVPDIAAALALVEGIAGAGLVVDCWHLFRGGMTLADLDRIPPGRVLCAQIGDATARPAGPLPEDTRHRLPCGEGALDIAGFVARLRRIGARCPLSVEIISPAQAALPLAEAARQSLASARLSLARPR
jgi:sugar phosphate isomerase/epimerase